MNNKIILKMTERKKELTLVTGFGSFLTEDKNSTEEIISQLPKKEYIVKKILPVGYFKKDILKHIKKYKPTKIVFLGMHPTRKNPMFEIIAKNEQITLKNKLYRFIVKMYSFYLKWNKKNLRIEKPISKEKLTIIPIQKNKKKKIILKTNPPENKTIGISENAGNYVCNYAIWIVENYVQKNNLDTKFYFIHIPKKLTTLQKEEVKKFIIKK
jgi:pyrrolidone-carboxylate peptidase